MREKGKDRKQPVLLAHQLLFHISMLKSIKRCIFVAMHTGIFSYFTLKNHFRLFQWKSFGCDRFIIGYKYSAYTCSPHIYNTTTTSNSLNCILYEYGLFISSFLFLRTLKKQKNDAFVCKQYFTLIKRCILIF